MILFHKFTPFLLILRQISARLIIFAFSCRFIALYTLPRENIEYRSGQPCRHAVTLFTSFFFITISLLSFHFLMLCSYAGCYFEYFRHCLPPRYHAALPMPFADITLSPLLPLNMISAMPARMRASRLDACHTTDREYQCDPFTPMS